MVTRARGAARPRRPVGVVLAGPTPRVGVEPYIVELAAGVEQVLHPAGHSLLLLVVDGLEAELATYRRWRRDGTVDAVVVVDLVRGDRRPAELARLGVPFVLAGHHDGGRPTTSVVTDDAAVTSTALEFLAGLGHRCVGRVTGPSSLVHTDERSTAMREAGERLGVRVATREADYTAEEGVRAAAELLALPAAPTALVFDNDVMAVAALEHLTRAGTRVPEDVSLLAADDSPLCELAVPGMSAVSTDVHARGVRLGEAVLQVLAGAPPRQIPGPRVRVVARGTTGRVLARTP
ncbi:substrate-binding domain-containing protein [Kineococcus vitellinus]|uniref:substrate-binding domain-containing protein n=1 Tax=Kineococcus vitellinus TaxID=2696565 RepID=UPI00196BAD10